MRAISRQPAANSHAEAWMVASCSAPAPLHADSLVPNGWGWTLFSARLASAGVCSKAGWEVLIQKHCQAAAACTVRTVDMAFPLPGLTAALCTPTPCSGAFPAVAPRVAVNPICPVCSGLAGPRGLLGGLHGAIRVGACRLLMLAADFAPRLNRSR